MSNQTITKAPKQDAKALAETTQGELVRVAKGYAVKNRDGSLSIFRKS